MALDAVQKSASLDTLFDTILSNDVISVVVPDFTRPLPFEVVMSAVERGFPNLKHWMVGLGLHRGLTSTERNKLATLTGKPILEHDPDDCTLLSSVGDVPFGIASPLLESDWVLTVGVIETHQYAGVSGGYKGVVVGCGDRGTISRLHARDMVCHPDVQVGKILGNPFRAEIERLGQCSPCELGLMWVPSLGEWWFGTPAMLMLEADRTLSPWVPVNTLYDGVVLSVPKSKGTSLYQASRAATYLALSPHPPLVNGATIVLDAEMIEGLGAEQGFVHYLHQLDPPWSESLSMDLVGAGSQRVWMLARLAKRYKLYVSGVHDASAFKHVGIPIFNKPIPAHWLKVTNPFEQIPQYHAVPSAD